MKTFSTALQAHYTHAVTALAEGWRVTRSFDGQVYGWTTADTDITIDGVVYRSSQGLMPSSAHTTNDLNVDTLDVTVFLDVSTELEVAAGLWDESVVVNFEFMYLDPPLILDASVHVKRAGTLGRLERKNLVLTSEIRGLADAFQTRIGRQYTPVCPWRSAIWNGTTYVASVECQANLAGLGFIHDGSLTEVGDDATLLFSDSASAQADAYYEAGGQITMTSGPNTGITREVLVWLSKAFTLLRPFPYPVSVGETYRAVRGDMHDEITCRDVFLNIINFGGFATVPGSDFVYATPAGI